MAGKPPWHMTPEEFGKAFPPIRTIGVANYPEWRYDLPGLEARDARAKAVADAHRHFVERALEEGCAVPDHVAALYRQPEPPPTPKVQAEPDYLRLVATPVNEAADAPERAARTQATLAKCLAETERERDRIVGAALLAHDDAQTLHRTVTTGLTRALAEHAEKQRAMTEAMRAGAEDRAAVMDGITATLADIARQQAKILSEARKPKPAKPKKWTFKVRRDSNGNLAGMDAEGC